MNLEEQLIYGQQAAEILENPVWKDVWSQYEAQITQQLMATPVSDVDALQKAVQALQLMRNLKAMIEQALATGKMADMELRRKSKMEQAKDWIADRIGI